MFSRKEHVHEEMRKCNVKRLTDENEGVKYPTVGSILKAVSETGRYPQWSYITFRDILLSMDIKMKAKSEVDRSILIEDEYIIEWRKRFLRNMEQYRFENRPIFYTDETYIDPLDQPRRLKQKV